MDNCKKTMLTEQRNKQSEMLDRLSVEEIIRIMNGEDQSVAASVEKQIPDVTVAIERIVDVVREGGRLFYVGAGTSGRLGILDASECPPTFGVDPSLVNGIIAGGDRAIRTAIENAEDDERKGMHDLAQLVTKRDAVVGITSSGRTPYVIGAVKKANEIGAVTIGLSCNPDAELSRHVRFPIEVPVGPEVVTGSTRLKAGTAQKMILNMISTTVMIKLGKVYGNLMVNVQATNEKLRKRVVRIIEEATGVDDATAHKLNVEAKGDARIAILMHMFGIAYEKAAETLQTVEGHFPKALEMLSSGISKNNQTL